MPNVENMGTNTPNKPKCMLQNKAQWQNESPFVPQTQESQLQLKEMKGSGRLGW